MDTNRSMAQRGQEAAQILDSEAFNAAFRAVREKIISQWKESSVRDAEGQRLLHQMIRIADDFESALRGTIEAGKFAQAQIDLSELRNESPARKLMRRVL